VSKLRRGSAVAAIALSALATLTWGALASPRLEPPPGSPDPALMVLRPADFGAGAGVRKQGYLKGAGSDISYARSFAHAPVAGKPVRVVDSQVDVTRSVAAATSAFGSWEKQISTRAGRARFLRSLEATLEKDLGEHPTSLRLGVVRHLRSAHGAAEISFHAGTPHGSIDGVELEVRVDRLLGRLVFLDPAAVSQTGISRLAKLLAGRMAAGLLPAATRPPSVTGVAQEAQTLTATTGTWRGGPTSYAYRWLRCNRTGVRCTAIPGATAASYVPLAPDVGSTIVVEVTARNGFGSATARSLPTRAVAAAKPGPPVNIARPTIVGVPKVGQTLTVTHGAWAGTPPPNSYGHYWYRCDSAGAGCRPLVGSIQQTYVVTDADLGSTIGAIVIAGNALGETVATAQPTAVVTA
jgi:hypothetical protein